MLRRTILRTLLGALLLLRSLTVGAQVRPLPDGVFAGLRWFKESDGDWNIKRDRPDIDYRLNKGWGLLLL